MTMRSHLSGDKRTKLAVLVVLLLTLLPGSRAFAGPVQLGVGGNLYGAFPVSVGGTLTEQFTLNQDTSITSFSVGIDPSAPFSSGGDWLLTLTGPGGVYWSEEGTPFTIQPFPSTLPAGSYVIELTGLSCVSPCVNPNSVVAWDYYQPATYYSDGGSVSQGNLGWELTGNVVPEPWTVTLFGSGLLGIIGVARRRFAAHWFASLRDRLDSRSSRSA